MSNLKITGDLAKELKEFGEEIEKEIIGTIKEVAEEAKEYIASISPRTNKIHKDGSKPYHKSWKVKKNSPKADDFQSYKIENDYFWKTHLLEYGHINRDKKTYARKFPHVAPTTKKYKPILEQKLKAIVEREKNI